MTQFCNPSNFLVGQKDQTCFIQINEMETSGSGSHKTVTRMVRVFLLIKESLIILSHHWVITQFGFCDWLNPSDLTHILIVILISLNPPPPPTQPPPPTTTTTLTRSPPQHGEVLGVVRSRPQVQVAGALILYPLS